MVNVPFIWAWKIGVTGKRPGQRAREINRANHKKKWYTGWFIPVSWVKVWGAWPIEQTILDLTFWAKCTVWGVGGTEIRFIFPGVILWALILIAAITCNYGAFLLRWFGPPVALYYLLENF